MKVKELIERLQECSEDLNVYSGYEKDNILKDSEVVIDVIQINKSSTEENNGVYLRV